MTMIGVFGGTFNPIHHGHLRIAQEIAETLRLSQIKFIPSANPPHKTTPQVSASQRAAMVQLAIQDNPLFSLDTRELARTGPSYTIDTLKSLRDENSEATFCVIIGSDAFANFDQWHAWELILEYCHLILVPRPSGDTTLTLSPALNALMKTHGTQDSNQLTLQPFGCIISLPVTALDISSSQIRTLMQQHQNPIYLAPQNVIAYFTQHQLY
ncbi:MAG: nicotinic acid mononucleotide adenylyltransferase [Methylophilaceae bacterium 17-44-8]|jgi:nicotinate-nucleotide adenylyltransferase|nr:MAG: nicotinic acid mononucleotide adenylyltransferase [Methylophilales bacterium 28-44-11]OYZ06093.1 MAG: nicotinic acid mononucleotide adenylyltransferase [Methylophilales bacterium 16-45-7]OZA06434.1 MAG: nicotinic acid mononucleotide adenylyltransferase [Methylophilaceae bacterium 17-44-8]